MHEYTIRCIICQGHSERFRKRPKDTNAVRTFQYNSVLFSIIQREGEFKWRKKRRS